MYCSEPGRQGADASGTVSDFESSWQLEELHEVGHWAGATELFAPYLEGTMELPVYFVGEDSLMTAVQDNYYDLRVADKASGPRSGLTMTPGRRWTCPRCSSTTWKNTAPPPYAGLRLRPP